MTTTTQQTSTSTSTSTDVIIVGGGIVGGALATVLAREGVDVLVLERTTDYRDRNKGELMVPWGWADAHHMGLTSVLDEAAGMPNPEWEIVDPDGLARPVPVGQLHPVAPGSYSVSHPSACAALTAAARSAGADVRFGATDATVEPGSAPAVTWQESGREQRATARLVVGADGRRSSVRRQLGLPLHRTERTHLISSVLVGGVRDLGDHMLMIGYGERLHLVVPMAGDRARIYLVSREDTFGGIDDARRLIEESQIPVAPNPERWAGTPVGPCATYGGEDTWIDRPAANGCVLVGDAAGHNSPIIGQGLALSMRDALVVSQALLSTDRWTDELFDHYAAERAERLRRVRFIAQLWAKSRLAPDEQILRLREHPLVQPIIMGVLLGFDDTDPSLFTEETAVSLLGDDRAAGVAATAGS